MQRTCAAMRQWPLSQKGIFLRRSRRLRYGRTGMLRWGESVVIGGDSGGKGCDWRRFWREGFWLAVIFRGNLFDQLGSHSFWFAFHWCNQLHRLIIILGEEFWLVLILDGKSFDWLRFRREVFWLVVFLVGTVVIGSSFERKQLWFAAFFGGKRFDWRTFGDWVSLRVKAVVIGCFYNTPGGKEVLIESSVGGNFWDSCLFRIVSVGIVWFTFLASFFHLYQPLFFGIGVYDMR